MFRFNTSYPPYRISGKPRRDVQPFRFPRALRAFFVLGVPYVSPDFIHSHRLVGGNVVSGTSARTRLVSRRETKSLRDRNIPTRWNVAPWWRKQYRPSAGRPEIPQNFRPAQSLPCDKRREADFIAPLVEETTPFVSAPPGKPVGFQARAVLPKR
jgi:hypothetical protein